MIDLLIEDLASRAAHLYVEADSAVGQVACRTDIMPIALSDQARRALCEKVRCKRSVRCYRGSCCR